MRQGFGTESDPLGRYYTDPVIGQVFVSLFDRRHASSILDLGSGGGSLTVAAARRWVDARIQTVDVDLGAEQHIRLGMASAGHQAHEHLVADVLDENLPDMVGGPRFDLAVCNPPYTRIRWRDGFARILAEAGLERLHAVPSEALSSDIMFIAQILRLAERGAEIGVIVPDGLVSARRSRAIRQALLDRVRVMRVVQLPRGSFRGTEAQAHVIVFRNECGRGEPVEISSLDVDGTSSPITVGTEAAEFRMDYGFYRSIRNVVRHGFTLRGIQAEITRGSLSSAEARECSEPIFHTNGFNQHSPLAYRLSGQRLSEDRPGRRIAEPGDILLARVDRELQRKICVVTHGRAIITDCIYRIRVPATWRDTVARGLLSDAGQAALVRASRGVGARMLNKEDLLDLEIETP
ncbi:N-6 DNA methylase [Mesorhizobium sp. VK24D]|uniref:N-6 DNA methylase n=1 Tax=Mesorhizobium album TaxID=3072314 RepID=A0ABU4XT55_9HYPH|nr:N-6 DNA methylase [Mesorhizobium sp. VK24D]MDX8477895.1 N-6 DNA methylase [Mesorhizobium sp. VK24D]